MSINSVDPVGNSSPSAQLNTAAWQSATSSAQAQIEQQGANAAIMILGQLGMQIIENLQQEEANLSNP